MPYAGESATWYEARDSCTDNNATLVVIAIHSRLNVWETKIVASEQEGQQARSMHQQLMAAKSPQKQGGWWEGADC